MQRWVQTVKTSQIQLTCLALLLFVSSRLASASDFNSLQELVRLSFTGEYSGFLVTKANVIHVEVCGDTCSYFEWRGNADDERYWRFITLFELSDAPGNDVEAFLRNVKTLKVEDLVDKTFCGEISSDVSKIACNWQAYAETLHIKIGHSRYDEGQRCYASVTDLKSRASSDWKCSPMKPGQSPFK
jgi:hypothetical protein